MAHRKVKPILATEPIPSRTVEHFGVPAKLLRASQNIRIDASHFNPAVARALEVLRRSEMRLVPLGEIATRVFIPPRFKRIYVDAKHGIPFLQGSHIVHFQPADVKYVSRTAHKDIERWIIESGWLLVTRSGTVGRVAVCPPEWNNWAASEHILRIIPDEDACPSGYLYAFLSSQLGHIQLTSKIYGAVVDELTEDQTKSVLVPLPITKEQHQEVVSIDQCARAAIIARSKAIKLVSQATHEMADLLCEDKHDIAIASQRLKEIKRRPDTLIRGKALTDALAALEHP